MASDIEEATRAYLSALTFDDPDAARVMTMAVENEVRFVRGAPAGVITSDPDGDRLQAYRHLEAVRRVVGKGTPTSEMMVAFVTGSPWPPITADATDPRP
jgi:hypothetical protein